MDGTTVRIELVLGTKASFHLSHNVRRKFGYLHKLGYFPLGLCPKLWTWKISPLQVDRVVNKTRRRRRRSSLLTTPIRQSTSRGCLLQVGQLYHSDSIAAICGFVVQLKGGSVAEWLACWTQAQKGLGSNRSRDAVGKQSQANCSHPSCLCSPSSKIGSSPLKGCWGNFRPGGK